MLVDLIKLSWSNTVVFIILVLMDTKLIIDKSTVIDKKGKAKFPCFLFIFKAGYEMSL